jgi:hypothetical protein
MTRPPAAGPVPICTRQGGHPAVEMTPGGPTAAWTPGGKRNWATPVSSYAEWRCPACGLIRRLSTRRRKLLATGPAGPVDLSYMS